ncbi:hypothetical protein [Phenylobacterium sp.]|uniref:hypothetical protein n=1 Tax=Phenylobacterium sp. TaxID=1871053 RepID=UPI0025DB5CD7|nr:hypothetical protein [Phenylobacterium sp.]
MTKVDAARQRRASLQIIASQVRERTGLAAAIATILAFCGGLAMLSLPKGPARAAYGMVTGLGFDETQEGSRPYADVSVEGRSIHVALPGDMVCRVGDRIALARQKTVAGERHTVTPPGCDRP